MKASLSCQLKYYWPVLQRLFPRNCYKCDVMGVGGEYIAFETPLAAVLYKTGRYIHSYGTLFHHCLPFGKFLKRIKYVSFSVLHISIYIMVEVIRHLYCKRIRGYSPPLL